MTPALEHDLLRRVSNFITQLGDSREVEKVIARALRLSMSFFGVPEGCVAVVHTGRRDAEILLATPTESVWDRTMLAGFLRKEEVHVGPDIMLSRVRRFGRMWGVLAVRSPRGEFSWDVRQAFSSIGAAATQLIERIEDERVREVRRRIDAAVAATGKPIWLEVDGGGKADNIADVARAGADTFVAGSAIFGTRDYAATIRQMRERLAVL